MSRRLPRTSWLPSAAAACLSIAACSAPTLPPNWPAMPPLTMAPERLAQRGYDSTAVFQLCRGTNCPHPTPKTLGAVAPSTASPLPATATAMSMGASVKAIVSTEPAGEPSEAPAPALPAFEQQTVHFPLGSAQLNTASRALLLELAPRLAQADDITLSGRTDTTGAPAVNEALAQARVQAALRELVRLMPTLASRITPDAQGGCCFVASNDSPEGRAQNRRVEIRYRPRADTSPSVAPFCTVPNTRYDPPRRSGTAPSPTPARHPFLVSFAGAHP